MKRLTLILAMGMYCLQVTAQEDSVKTKSKPDTIRIGNILIIKKEGTKNPRGDNNQFDSTESTGSGTKLVMGRKRNSGVSRVNTSWWIVDLGFANYSDQTNYGNTGSYLVNNPAPGVAPVSASDFKLKAGKSVNVNIWFFMQELALIKNNVNLKYGLGLELNNYRYKTGLTYKEGGIRPYNSGVPATASPFIFRQDSVGLQKNKLAADYLTIPVMLNFASTPSNDKKGISVSFGVSAGYLYSQRNKQKSDAYGKKKNKGEYDLDKFKIAYIAELGLGPVKLYGSYSTKSMYEHDLNIRPYTFGFRLIHL